MIRIFVTSGLLFLLPFALFAIYATVTDYLVVPTPGEQAVSAWQNPPLGWLAGIGAALVIGTILYLAVTSNSSGRPGGIYHPPTIKDGKLQPGYVE